MLVATVRSVKLGRIAASTTLQCEESWMELDTHADTTVLGRGCLIIQDFNRVVSVSGWNAATGSTECPTVTGVVAYDHPYTRHLHACMASGDILGHNGESPSMPDAVSREWSGGE